MMENNTPSPDVEAGAIAICGADRPGVAWSSLHKTTKRKYRSMAAACLGAPTRAERAAATSATVLCAKCKEAPAERAEAVPDGFIGAVHGLLEEASHAASCLRYGALRARSKTMAQHLVSNASNLEAAIDRLRRHRNRAPTRAGVLEAAGAKGNGSLVDRRWVILKETGRIPVKNGPFRSETVLIAFLRDGLALWAADAGVTVVRQAGTDLWVDDGREYLHIHDALTEPEAALAAGDGGAA